jgi:phage terminase Nu1 subunit (DNA packaging protein)
MGVSMAKFAAMRKVTKQAVSKWKARGLLVFDDDGTVNVEASTARVDGRAEVYRGGATKREAPATVPALPAPSETLEDKAERLIESGVVTMLSHADAVAKKENFLALLRELEYDQASGAVVAIANVEREVVAQLSRVRTKLLGIPSKVAGRVALLKSAEEVQAFLDEEVALALMELTGDTDGLAGLRKVQGRRSDAA